MEEEESSCGSGKEREEMLRSLDSHSLLSLSLFSSFPATM